MAKKMDMENDADDAHDPYEAGGDVAAQGFRKIAFGGDDKENHVIHSAYVKQAAPKDSAKTSIHELALHQQNSHFYSDKAKSKSKPEKI